MQHIVEIKGELNLCRVSKITLLDPMHNFGDMLVGMRTNAFTPC
jgi:hypothetical protein